MEWISVGIGGLDQLPNTLPGRRNPVSRVLQQQSERRVVINFAYFFMTTVSYQKLIHKGIDSRGVSRSLNKNYIQNEVSYRFVVKQNIASIRLVRAIEVRLKNGLDRLVKPLPNGMLECDYFFIACGFLTLT